MTGSHEAEGSIPFSSTNIFKAFRFFLQSSIFPGVRLGVTHPIQPLYCFLLVRIRN